MKIEQMVGIYNAQFDEWNRDFEIERASADEVILDIEFGVIDIPDERKEEVLVWLRKFINMWDEGEGCEITV